LLLYAGTLKTLTSVILPQELDITAPKMLLGSYALALMVVFNSHFPKESNIPLISGWDESSLGPSHVITLFHKSGSQYGVIRAVTDQLYSNNKSRCY
jgi:hypothetical protein